MAWSRKAPTQPQRALTLQFVNEDGKTRSDRSKISIVRSHVRKHTITQKKQRNELTKPVGSVRVLETRTLPEKSVQDKQKELSWSSPKTLLGAGKSDPFGCYPISGAPWIDQLIQHYVTIYEIAAVNGRNNAFTYLLYDWIPMCISSELAFLSILLYTEVGIAKRRLYGATNTSPWTVRAIQLSSKCTTILRKEIATISYPSAAKKKSHPSGVTDGMIIAITNMAMLELFIIRDPIAFESHRRGLAQLVELRGGIDSLQGTLKIMASKIVGNEEFAQSPAVRADGTNPRVEEVIDTPSPEVHDATRMIKTDGAPEEGDVEEPAPLTYNNVLDILGPT